MTTEEIKKKIVPVLKQYGVTKAALFGSSARGNMTKNSDVDVLVEIPKAASLLEFIRLKLNLEDTLGRKVDLVEYQVIKPAIKEDILNSQVSIL